MKTEYFEREGAVFRERDDAPMEIFYQDTGKWGPYTGDAFRVRHECNPMALEEVYPYMDVEPQGDFDGLDYGSTEDVAPDARPFK